jgi:hypothetical protein
MSENIKKEDYEIIFEERKENENLFEQINEIAVAKDATLLVLGFRGKGSNIKGDQLSKSVTYLVHKPKIPVLVVKFKTRREYRSNSDFKWLVCIESNESKSFKALNSMIRFVDSEVDVIHGLTIDMQQKEESINSVKKVFEELMLKNDIKNSLFSIVPCEHKMDVKAVITKWIETHLKTENHFIDFVVLGYNPMKYINNKDVPNTTVDLLKEVNCNVYFDH